MKLPLFIDFEASSLSPSSYPIQVAWSDSSGEIESYYINPDKVDGWDDWDMVTQDKVHNISRELLTRKGESPLFVAEKMNSTLINKTVFSDAVPYDTKWNEVLFKACNLKPLFSIKDIWDVLGEVLPDEYLRTNLRGQNYKRDVLINAARTRVKKRHDAKYDVQFLIELYCLARKVSVGL